MALRLYVNLATLQLVDGPNGGPIGTEQNPLRWPMTLDPVEWQFLQTNGELQVPFLQPVDTEFGFAFKVKGQYDADDIIGLDPISITRPEIGTGAEYLVNRPTSGYLAQATAITVDGGSGTILAGDIVTIGSSPYTVFSGLPGDTGGTFVIEQPGLLENVPDNTAVTIISSANFYKGVMIANTSEAMDLLGVGAGPDVGSADLGSNFTWKPPYLGPTDDPFMSQRVFGTLENVYPRNTDAVPPSASFSAVLTDATTMRTLALSDMFRWVAFTNAGAVAVTLPLQATVAWTAGTEFHLIADGATGVTVTGAMGVAIEGAGVVGTMATTSAEPGVIHLKQLATDRWLAWGDTTVS